ncbi:MAG TPA: dockerin type I repeat-containing protein [Ruminococcus flavefaciens]|nr:dockerin type I repeat-containing protein [Ruminococcus flavefaciens]
MRLKKAVSAVLSAVMFVSLLPMKASADEWYFAGSTCEPLHDTTRDIQTEGVGNPLNFGERNTPADASTEEIRAINHKMTVQEVKYALYKEIDEHRDLISTRLGQPDREKMYALFLGLGSRESTLGEGKIGSDHETAYADGWGVNSARAYGTLQTAVTAFADCDPKFMPEDNVPEMFQYSFTPSNFYDCIISNHMGIRKILHFAEICINEENMHGYQVIRNSLKGFNTGWCYMAEDDGAYKTYADEICSMAQFYYYEGHLYDNVFTWTSAGGEMEKYRTADRWDWWGDTEPSMAPVEEKQQPVVKDVVGDVNGDGSVSIADAVELQSFLLGKTTELTVWKNGDVCRDERLNAFDLVLLRKLVSEADNG